MCASLRTVANHSARDSDREAVGTHHEILSDEAGEQDAVLSGRTAQHQGSPRVALLTTLVRKSLHIAMGPSSKLYDHAAAGAEYENLSGEVTEQQVALGGTLRYGSPRSLCSPPSCAKVCTTVANPSARDEYASYSIRYQAWLSTRYEHGAADAQYQVLELRSTLSSRAVVRAEDAPGKLDTCAQ